MEKQTANYYSKFELELFEGSLTSHVYPWHYHNCYTLILVLKGAMKYVFRGEEVLVKQNQVFIVNPFTSHYNFAVKYCDYKAVFIPVHYFSSTVNSNLFIQFEGRIRQDKRLFRKLSELVSGVRDLELKRDVEDVQKQMAKLILESFEFEQKSVSIDPRLIPAIEFIKSHMAQKLKISAISKTCHLSPFHFQRLFKKNTGLTVNEYIQQLRTEAAKELLRKGSDSISTGFETGYFDQSHFHKAFKKMWVAKPSQF